MFRITDSKGFHMTFDNGVTISVQFGRGNYCENYGKYDYDYPKNNDIESKDAEIAIWTDDFWITKEFTKEVLKEEGYDVQGNLTANQVLEAMNWASKYELK